MLQCFVMLLQSCCVVLERATLRAKVRTCAIACLRLFESDSESMVSALCVCVCVHVCIYLRHMCVSMC